MKVGLEFFPPKARSTAFCRLKDIGIRCHLETSKSQDSRAQPMATTSNFQH